MRNLCSLYMTMSLLASFFGRNTNFLEYFLGFASENSAKFVLRPQNEASNGPLWISIVVHQFRPERTNMHLAFLQCSSKNFLYKLAHLLLHLTLRYLPWTLEEQ